jgi:hypothetical protein
VPFRGSIISIFLSSIFLSAFRVFRVFRGFNSGFLACGFAALRLCFLLGISACS